MKKYRMHVHCDICGKEIPGATENSHTLEILRDELRVDQVDVCPACTLEAVRVHYGAKLQEIFSEKSAATKAVSQEDLASTSGIYTRTTEVYSSGIMAHHM